jgi:hypothetical protein
MQYELTMWALRTPGMADVARRQYELYLEAAATSWSAAAAKVGVPLAVPAEQLARLFLAGLDGLILQYLTLRDAERSRADLEVLVRQTTVAATAQAG